MNVNVLIALLILLTALVSGALGAWVAMMFKEDISENRLKSIEENLNEITLTTSEMNRITRAEVSRIEQRESNHWNFINQNCKLW